MSDETYPFGFTVQSRAADEWRNRPAGWTVTLPHQCDEWPISGDEWAPVSHEQAIADLERFIAEAQQALEALRAGQQYGEDGR